MSESYYDTLADLRARYPKKTTLTVAEACQELSVSRNTLLGLINRRGGIRAKNVGKGRLNFSYRIAITEIARYATT